MSWAARRRFLVLLILGSVAVAFLAVIIIATVYETPSCVDQIQNQDEVGVDCGGSCAYLCVSQVQPPTVLFTKTVSNGAGRIDLLSSIENKNVTAAAKRVPYRVRLYGDDQMMLQEVRGTIDLPPAATTVVFLPGLASSRQQIANVFLEIDPSAPRWFSVGSDPRILPTVSNSRLGGTSSAPRVDATLSNPTLTTLTNVRVIVLVRDAQGNYIGVSSTILPTLSAQGTATAHFTWNGPFSGTPTSIEIVPDIPLPLTFGPQ